MLPLRGLKFVVKKDATSIQLSQSGNTGILSSTALFFIPVVKQMNGTIIVERQVNPRKRIEHELLEMLGSRLSGYLPVDGHENPAVWVRQTFRLVKLAVAAGDPQAISLACELIERDPKLPFGKLVKSDLARALKKQTRRLIESERRQVLAATEKLLCQEYAPRELEDYCKLVKKFPREEVTRAIAGVTPMNPKSAHLLGYLRDDA